MENMKIINHVLFSLFSDSKTSDSSGEDDSDDENEINGNPNIEVFKESFKSKWKIISA